MFLQHYGLEEEYREFNSFDGFLQQIKTTVVLPIIGLSFLLEHLNNTLRDLLIMGAGILSLSPSLFLKGLKDAREDFWRVLNVSLIYVLVFAHLVLIFMNILEVAFCCANGDSASKKIDKNKENPLPKSSSVYDSGYKLFEDSIKAYGLQKMQPLKPFNSLDDVQKDIKTTLVLPIIASWSILKNLSKVCKDLLIMAIAIPFLSSTLFFTGLNDLIAHVQKGVVHPLLICCMEFVFLLSTLTRPCASIFCPADSSSSNLSR